MDSSGIGGIEMTEPKFTDSEWRVLCGAVAYSHFQPEAEDLPAAKALLARELIEGHPGFACLHVTSEGWQAWYEAAD
jgi:hypothetical protein